jgi:hypothetical protein
MSKVAIQGAATGTGVFTLASPATNTNRTLTLPDEAGTVLTRAAGSPDNSVVVDASGNVGVKTSSPASALHVTGASRLQRIGSANAFEWYVSSGNNLFLTDIVNATEPFRVTNTGHLQFNSGYGSAATAYGCRAWVNFNGTGTVAIKASGNVSSITDLGVGRYRVNLTTAMPDANYAQVIGIGDYGIVWNGNSALGITDNGTKTTTFTQMDLSNNNTIQTDFREINVTIFR